MISNTSLVALLRLKCNDQFMYAKTLEQEEAGYVEIFRRPYDGAVIGISNKGNWCLINQNTLYPLRSEADADVFLLLLYTPLQEVIALAKYGLNCLRLPEDVCLTFPFDEIITHALLTKWRPRAIQWIAEGYPMNDHMREIVYGKDRQDFQWLEYERARKGPLLGI